MKLTKVIFLSMAGGAMALITPQALGATGGCGPDSMSGRMCPADASVTPTTQSNDFSVGGPNDNVYNLGGGGGLSSSQCQLGFGRPCINNGGDLAGDNSGGGVDPAVTDAAPPAQATQTSSLGNDKPSQVPMVGIQLPTTDVAAK